MYHPGGLTLKLKARYDKHMEKGEKGNNIMTPSDHTATGDGLRHRQPGHGPTPSEQLQTEDIIASTPNRLLSWDDIHPWQQDNAYILTGYRQASSSYRGSFASLSYVHNETVNIWSHLLGAIAFLLLAAAGVFVVVFLEHEIAPRYASASRTDVFVFGCFFAGAIACLGMSATYHCLSNHSPVVAKWGNKLDYAGIVLLIVGSYVPAMYYGFRCHTRLMSLYLSNVSRIPPVLST